TNNLRLIQGSGLEKEGLSGVRRPLAGRLRPSVRRSLTDDDQEAHVDRYRALASLPKIPQDTLGPVSLCRSYALIQPLSPQGLRTPIPSHTITTVNGGDAMITDHRIYELPRPL